MELAADEKSRGAEVQHLCGRNGRTPPVVARFRGARRRENARNRRLSRTRNCSCPCEGGNTAGKNDDVPRCTSRRRRDSSSLRCLPFGFGSNSGRLRFFSGAWRRTKNEDDRSRAAVAAAQMLDLLDLRFPRRPDSPRAPAARDVLSSFSSLLSASLLPPPRNNQRAALLFFERGAAR